MINLTLSFTYDFKTSSSYFVLIQINTDTDIKRDKSNVLLCTNEGTVWFDSSVERTLNNGCKQGLFIYLSLLLIKGEKLL